MITEATKKLVQGESLDFDTACAVMNEMMSGEATNSQMASFLTALRMKGETIDEITACAQVMRDKAVHINTDKDILDIVGTGGDGIGTFNISTTASFIIAAAGINVAKHGNRSMSSKSGSADCLEHLGINITISAERSKEILEEIGICFMFAQGYHKSMKFVGPVRKEIGIRNVFNILGPLTNPANANMQVMGVYSEELLEPLARVLSNLGVERGMTIYGCDGMDEATVTTKTKICEINKGEFKTYEITPQDVGLNSYTMDDLIGGDGELNAGLTRDILSDKLKGAMYEIVLLNAGLGIYVGGKADTIKEGIDVAKEMIESGKALKKLNEFVELSNR
ncbi:MAG: anthranilate phosphoribosyltransferase [Oscillospiraceae bacterium]|nr:anthranilate phosphoribosyltransferase [Oscillospiraceae bacterium]